MRFILWVIALSVLAGGASAENSISDNMRQFRDFSVNKPGAHWSEPEKAKVNKPVAAPKQPTVQQPAKEQAKPLPQKENKVPQQNPHKDKAPIVNHGHGSHNRHNNHHNPHHDKHISPQPPKHSQPVRKITVYEAPLINRYTYVTSTPEVSYVTSGSGVIYNANPHIYSPNAYVCHLKNDLNYCTDSLGKPLTGRIVQNYTQSIAYENYKKGYLEGETYIYTTEGTLLQVTNYAKGLKHGKETVYFGNGKVHYIAYYSKGLLNGDVKQYDISGTLLGEMRYRKGHYTYRYCRNDTQNDLMRDRIKANEKNELILCADY